MRVIPEAVRGEDYRGCEIVCRGREIACSGRESHCRGLRGLAEAVRLTVEAVRVLSEVMRVIVEAVRKIIEAVRLLLEAMRLLVEAVRVLRSSTNKSIPINPRSLYRDVKYINHASEEFNPPVAPRDLPSPNGLTYLMLRYSPCGSMSRTATVAVTARVVSLLMEANNNIFSN